MTSSNNLKEVKKGEIDDLLEKNNMDITNLWNRIGEDFDNGTTTVANELKIDHQQLIHLLIDQVKKENEIWKEWWLKQHWLDFGVILGLTIFVVLGWRSIDSFISIEESTENRNIVVNDDAEIPPYHVIGDNDVTMKEAPHEPGTFLLEKEVIGRYSLTAIPPGEPLKSNQLSKVQLLNSELQGSYLVSIPIKVGATSPSIDQGSLVSLLLSPVDSDTNALAPLLIKDVVVLSLEKTKDTTVAVVAVPSDEIKIVIPQLNKSNAFLLRVLP